MSKIIKIAFAIVLIAAFDFLMATLTHGHTVATLNPQGIVADRERDLVIFTVLLGLIIVIQVIVLLFVFAWRYREGNTKAKYSPSLDHTSVAEIIWWFYKGVNAFRTIDDVAWGRKMFFSSLTVLLAISAAIPLGAILP